MADRGRGREETGVREGLDAGRPSLRVAALVLLGVSLAAFGPFLYSTVRSGPSCWGVHDWAQFYAWYDLPRVALVQHGQLAFWNPYVSGGVPGFAHTHDATFSPVFLVVLLLGPVTGTRVLMVAWTYVGMMSMFALARAFGVRRLGCYLAAVVWGLNGNHLLHVMVGHVQHVPMVLLPLIVLLFLRVRTDRANLFLTALVVGGLVLGGAIYAVTYAALLLALLALWLAILEGTTRWFSRLVLVGFYSVLFAAVKLVAAVPYLLNKVATPPDVSGTGIRFLWRRLVSPEPPWVLNRFAEQTLGYWEFGAYVGAGVVVLFGVGLVAVVRRARTGDERPHRMTRLGALLITAVAFLLLSFGSAGPVNVFGLLRRVPILSAMHVPFRFVTVPLMMLALVAGMGLDWLVGVRGKRGAGARPGWRFLCPRTTPSQGGVASTGTPTPARGQTPCVKGSDPFFRAAQVVATALIVVVAVDLARAHQHHVPAAFALDAIDVAGGTAAATRRSRLPGHEDETGAMTVADVGPAGDALFEQRRVAFSPGAVGSRRWRDHHVIEPHSPARYLMQLQGRGNVEGYEMLRREAAVRWVGHPEYRGEVYLEHGSGWARLVAFSPSRFTVEVSAAEPDVLFLNQTVYGGWYVTIDGRSERVSTTRRPGLVSAEVPAGHRRVEFWFRPDGFWTGLAVTVGSLLAVPLRILIVHRRKKGSDPFRQGG